MLLISFSYCGYFFTCLNMTNTKISDLGASDANKVSRDLNKTRFKIDIKRFQAMKVLMKGGKEKKRNGCIKEAPVVVPLIC